jgi:uroporphyrinogen decarboxylase
MSPKQRAAAALELKTPDVVPTFELEFQLWEELLGRSFPSLDGLSGDELDRTLGLAAEMWLEAAEILDYSIIRSHDPRVIRRLAQEGAADRYLLCGEADGTMAIPDGNSMEDLAIRLLEDPEGIHQELSDRVDQAIEWGARQIEAGAEMITMCSDYCFNTAPFLSPKMFGEFVTPYLARQTEAHRRNGAYVVKHTDGNIMPILDQLASTQPHGLHSLDPQAGMDIAVIKSLVGDRLCLCGNVNCALMQTGTLEQVRESPRYALVHGMPGGGFIFCTSNVAFKGMPLESYLTMLDVRAEVCGLALPVRPAPLAGHSHA